MGLRACFAALAAGLSFAACGAAEPAEPEPLDLPDWEVCLADWGGDIQRMLDAVDRGEEAAIICDLAVSAWREPDRATFVSLYRLYRLRGREPEGLDALARELERDMLAARLLNIHAFSAELEEVDRGFWGCPDYDPVARELILRAEPGGDMVCVPRRWGFWG